MNDYIVVLDDIVVEVCDSLASAEAKRVRIANFNGMNMKWAHAHIKVRKVDAQDAIHLPSPLTCG